MSYLVGRSEHILVSWDKSVSIIIGKKLSEYLLGNCLNSKYSGRNSPNYREKKLSKYSREETVKTIVKNQS